MTKAWRFTGSPMGKRRLSFVSLRSINTIGSADNRSAIEASLEAMRAIERHGGAEILDRAFQGFQALPSPNDWPHVMRFEETPIWEEVEKKYRTLSKQPSP